MYLKEHTIHENTTQKENPLCLVHNNLIDCSRKYYCTYCAICNIVQYAQKVSLHLEKWR